ncbi:MAG TPA: AglZ/HisF2 family acetamidino modification protein [Flavipsychrobacter sp.]|nr:AglZ/HisF2 family acetamidino modification protein [Flavipsychrobacter sp.]
MRRIRTIPVLLLKNGGLYKTVGFKNPKYVGDPINAVKIFNEKETDELILLDYNASADGRSIDYKRIEEIAGEAFMPMAYGGGIKTLDDAKRVFDCGFEKVVLNSVLAQHPDLVEAIGSIYGAQAVVGSIDYKKSLFGKSKVFTMSGSKNLGHDPVEWAGKLQEYGVGEIMLNSIDKDGTWSGYDLEMIKKVSEKINVPLIACGGAGSVADLKDGVQAGASAVAAGSMFVFQKKGMGVLISFPAESIIYG